MIEIYQKLSPVDILAFGVHPDDVELSCSATLLKHIDLGYKVGVVDLTKGELGSRGSAKIRMKEAANAAEILGVSFRANLEMRDGFFENNEINLRKIIKVIRQTKPKIILANALDDRHADHGRAAKLVADAFFYSGLRRIRTGQIAEYRAERLYHYIQDKHLTPDICVDVSGYWEKKQQSILAFSTQFFTGEETDQPATPISSKAFMEFIESKMRVFGRSIGVDMAEGFNANRTVGADDLVKLI
jgi:bacillithiol biosynthesis deacetylase BshB1